MDFNYTTEQKALQDSVRRFTERQYGWEQRFEIIRAAPGRQSDYWPTFAELGWLGAGLSEEEGGFGGGAIENALIAQELGRALVIEPFVSHVIASQLLAAVGGERAGGLTDETVTGERRIVPALTEVEGRGDVRLVNATVTCAADGLRLCGAKSLVDGASSADSIIVSALEDQEIGLYLIDATAPGLSRQDYRTLDNHRVSDLAFADVLAERLARGEAAEAAIARAVDHGIVAICGESLGIMDAALWATRDYLKVRKQFGTTLSTFQALQHRMADMLIETELARSILFHAFGAIGRDALSRRAGVSAAKVVFAESGLAVTREAIQLHGGIGVTEELNISHYYRRLYVLAHVLGSADDHVDQFSRAADSRRD